MSDWTQKLPKAARDYIADRRLDEVECLVADLAGVAKGKAMPASRASIPTASMKPTFSVSRTKLMASPLAWQPKQ